MNRCCRIAMLWVAGLGLLQAQPQPAPLPDAPPAPVRGPQGDEVTPPPGPPAAMAPGGGPGMGLDRGRRREGGQQAIPGAFLEHLRQERPELHERLTRLYGEDRQRFFQEVRALMRERGLSVPEGDAAAPVRSRRESPEEQKCIELGRLYRETPAEPEKERLRGELADAVQAAFEARLGASKERIARLEEQLKDFRQHLDRLEANRDRICAERIEELTKPAELRWDDNW